ncbi:uncharacterized protein LOC111074616 [Drosophila obscura]|uniref:uncharacterized protein LOC111074616 n=1 Tax=Drosophila obscura TaxID=7282 RepID=UPI000B9FB8F7|nr:uncharacterized protein LOC111074616 [Drosophila obscura]
MDTSPGAKAKASKSSGSSQRNNYPSEWTDEMKAALEIKLEPRRTPSETSMQPSYTSHHSSSRSQPDEREEANESLHSEDLMGSSSRHSADQLATSRTSSISTIGSAHLPTTDPQTSDYTTESSYRTESEDDSSLDSDSYGSAQTSFGRAPTNFLREIHVAIDPTATAAQVESVRRDLRQLLACEMGMIRHSAARGSGEVIYLIAYHYM